jgi:hypothetical protein
MNRKDAGNGMARDAVKGKKAVLFDLFHTLTSPGKIPRPADRQEDGCVLNDRGDGAGNRPLDR